MEEREIVVEPFHSGWLAHFRGDRSYRVTADTPEEARRLLVAGEQAAASVHRKSSISGMAVLVCILVAMTLVVLRVTAQNAPVQHLVKWAHRHHYKLHH